MTGDGEHGAPGQGPFDAIIATAGAWDIPPSWTAQLADGGTLVVPLRMNGVTRVILSFRVTQSCDLRRPVLDSVADGTLAA